MISKPTIIITSLGRAGTKFFQLLFQEILPDATSLHEPDYLNFGQYRSTRKRIHQVLKQLRESGVSNLVLKKTLGKWSLVALSHARVRGEIDYQDISRRMLSQRKAFVQSRQGSVYVESSSAYYGLLDVLPAVYRNHRGAYIIRDGRSWVRSKMNFGTMYNKGWLRSRVSHSWPTALEIEDDPYHSSWEGMSRFEKICWAWTKLNRCALEAIQKNPNARVFCFEDIFLASDKYNNLANLVDFVTNLPGIPSVPHTAIEGWLERKIHRSQKRFPAWRDWSTIQKRKFTEICGPLMERLETVRLRAKRA